MMKTVRQDVLSTIFRFYQFPWARAWCQGVSSQSSDHLTVTFICEEIIRWKHSAVGMGCQLSYQSFFVGIREKNDSVGMKYSL